MSSKLQDIRQLKAMTVAEADAIFIEIARIKAQIEKEEAALKKRLAEATAAFQKKTTNLFRAKESLEKELTAYIIANPERFEKPKKHPVGAIGTYGITADKAYVVIQDKEEIIDYALINDYDDIIRTERTPDKDAILRRFNSGEDIPGAAVVPAGNVAKMSFKKGYAEQLENY